MGANLSCDRCHAHAYAASVGILDRNAEGESVGCSELFDRLETVGRGRTFLATFMKYGTEQRDGTLFINAVIGETHREPIVFDLAPETSRASLFRKTII